MRQLRQCDVERHFALGSDETEWRSAFGKHRVGDDVHAVDLQQGGRMADPGHAGHRLVGLQPGDFGRRHRELIVVGGGFGQALRDAFPLPFQQRGARLLRVIVAEARGRAIRLVGIVILACRGAAGTQQREDEGNAAKARVQALARGGRCVRRRGRHEEQGKLFKLAMLSGYELVGTYSAYCAKPWPNDQFSLSTSTRLMKTSSGRMPGSCWSRSTMRA